MNQVESGVEPQEQKKGAPTKYPWATMKVGDSLFFPCTQDHPKPWKSRTNLTAAVNKRYEKDGWRFMTRKHTNDDGTKGARIYRIK